MNFSSGEAHSKVCIPNKHAKTLGQFWNRDIKVESQCVKCVKYITKL